MQMGIDQAVSLDQSIRHPQGRIDLQGGCIRVVLSQNHFWGG